jgi:hypothetical protein
VHVIGQNAAQAVYCGKASAAPPPPKVKAKTS